MDEQQITIEAPVIEHGRDLIAHANGIVIRDNESLQRAVTLINHLNAFDATVEEMFGPLAKSAHEQHKKLLEAKNTFLTPSAVAKSSLREQIAKFVAENPTTCEAKGLAIRTDIKMTVTPDFSLEKVMALISKGKLPSSLLVIDPKVAASLVKAGIDIPGITKESVVVPVIR